MKDMLEVYVKTLIPMSHDKTVVSTRRAKLADALEACSLDAGFLFESGSWSHGTALRSKSDVDYMAWASGSRPALPSSALAAAKAAIVGSDWQITSVNVSSPVVAVRYVSAPHFEIVPAWWQSEKRSHDVFAIPGRRDEWVLSSPSAHLAFVNEQNDRLSKKVKPLVRLLKAWKAHVDAPISSFYLEMRAAEYCASESSIYYYIDVPAVMRSIISIGAREMNDPVGIVGRIPACASEEKRARSVRLLREAVSHFTAADAAMKSSDQSAYWRAMHNVYGADFPWPSW